MPPKGWVTLPRVFAALLVLYSVFEWGLKAETAADFLFVALAIAGVLLGFRLIRRFIWRLRNRLYVTYVFIGVVPIVLILALAASGTYITAGQVAEPTADRLGRTGKLDGYVTLSGAGNMKQWIDVNGPISALGSIRALLPTTADGCTPGTVGGGGWNKVATLAQAAYTSVVSTATAEAGTRSARSGSTITAPARVFSNAARYLRLSRKLTSAASAIASGATPRNIRRRGGAFAPAASTTSARLCGPVR